MIEGSLAVFLNIATIALITFIVANATISVVIMRSLPSLHSLHVSPRRSILWLLVLTPWLVAASVAGVFYLGYLDSELLGESANFIHWHHMATHYWMSWHSAVLVLALMFVSKIAVSLGRRLWKHHHDLKALTDFAAPSQNDVFEIDSPKPFAFTTGFLRKRCFVSSGLLQQMSLNEQDVVLTHEMAHMAHNDPFKKWLFAAFAEFFLPRIAMGLKHHMTVAMEQDADNASIEANHEPTFVAMTLVKMARISQESSPVQHNELVANFAAEALEQRVHFLLGQLQLKPVNKITMLLVSLGVIAVCVSSVDRIHHLMDVLFMHSGAITGF